MTSLEMRNLIFEALAENDPKNTPDGHTFDNYGYKGCVSNLRSIVEFIAIKYGLIEKVVEIPKIAWGAQGDNPWFKKNTNFDEDNLNLFNEELYILINHNVLSPGAIGNYGDNLPYFHVTKYGLNCLENRDVLPYDSIGYMEKISAISNIDDWEKFYIEQSLKCFNADAFEAAMLMIGLAGEYLANKLIENMATFLKTREVSLYSIYQDALQNKRAISQKYLEYEEILGKVLNIKDDSNHYKYPELREFSPLLDGAAKAIYATYLRLTRNGLAHPSNLKMDRVECFTIMTCYIKYCETQYKYLSYFTAHSSVDGTS